MTGVQTCALPIFIAVGVALAGIDLQKQLLPDRITVPMTWVGLLFNIPGTFTQLPSAVLGAVTGYLVLWGIFHLFKLITGKDGLGYGDFKLLAMAGAWLGWQSLPLTLFLAAFAGATASLVFFANGKLQRGTPIPFGPFLVVGLLINLFWGHPLMQFYFGLAH